MTDSSPFVPEGYALVRPIGRGASSAVWEARVVATDEPVALKILDDDVPAPNAVRFLAGERAASGALARHRNILTVRDAGIQDGRPWLAAELCRRGSLSTVVADGGPLEVPTALRVLARLAGALAVAHDAGVLHCDVTPANVMLTDAGEPALADFGITRAAVPGACPDHVAPELLDGGKPSPRSDVHSLGTTLRELLLGHPAGDPAAGPAPKPESERIPDDVRKLLDAMSARGPDERPASMAAVGAAVQVLAHGRGIALDEPALPPIPAVAAPPDAALDTVALPTGAPATAPATDVLPTDVRPTDAAHAAPGPAGRSASSAARSADGWSAPLPPEQVLTFDPAGSAAYTPWAANPDDTRVFTTPAPFRPRDEEPEPEPRVPLVVATVLAVLITVGAAVGIGQGGADDSAAPPVTVAPAAMVPTPTPPEPTPTPTPTPVPTSAPTSAKTSSAVATAQPRTRTTRTSVTRPRATPDSSSDDDDSSKAKKKKKKSSD